MRFGFSLVFRHGMLIIVRVCCLPPAVSTYQRDPNSDKHVTELMVSDTTTATRL